MEPDQPGAGAKPRAAKSLLEITRDPQLYLTLKALLDNKIYRDIFTGALPHFLYDVEGDQTLASEEALKTIYEAIASATGRRRVRATPRRLPGLQGQDTLVLAASIKQELLMELVELAANMTASDFESLPPPLDLQQNQA
jgi:hypothetical protein